MRAASGIRLPRRAPERATTGKLPRVGFEMRSPCATAEPKASEQNVPWLTPRGVEQPFIVREKYNELLSFPGGTRDRRQQSGSAPAADRERRCSRDTQARGAGGRPDGG